MDVNPVAMPCASSPVPDGQPCGQRKGRPSVRTRKASRHEATRLEALQQRLGLLAQGLAGSRKGGAGGRKETPLCVDTTRVSSWRRSTLHSLWQPGDKHTFAIYGERGVQAAVRRADQACDDVVALLRCGLCAGLARRLVHLPRRHAHAGRQAAAPCYQAAADGRAPGGRVGDCVVLCLRYAMRQAHGHAAAGDRLELAMRARRRSGCDAMRHVTRVRGHFTTPRSAAPPF